MMSTDFYNGGSNSTMYKDTFNVIAACDDNRGIGVGGIIPWRYTAAGREDMKEFRAKTLHGVVIMGRKTFISIGKPLTKRCNIVISRDNCFTVGTCDTLLPGAQVFNDGQSVYTARGLDEALMIATRYKQDNKLSGSIWVIGGAEIYAIALEHPKLHRAYISYIHGDHSCNVFLPQIAISSFGKYVRTIDTDVTVGATVGATVGTDVTNNTVIPETITTISTEIFGNIDEERYLDLMRRLISAPTRPNRTGINTRGLFAERLEFALMRGDKRIVPALTTKRVPTKIVIAELLWFLSGKCTDITKLHDNNCHIWDDNTTREFLDSRGLSDYSEGECGPIYGYQWRSWNRPYTPTVRAVNTSVVSPAANTYEGLITDTTANTCGANTTNVRPDHCDQISNVIRILKTNPFDRRMIVSAWNPEQLNQMALPPCHWSFQFHCEYAPRESARSQKYSLNCLLNMRSADVALGVPFNIMSYALLTHMIATCVNMRPGKLVIMMADCHLYENHIEGALEQVSRKTGQFPTLTFRDDITVDGPIDQFNSIDQIIIENYQPHPAIKYPMAI